MERLSETASGLRHLRWSREVLATLEAHYEHNPKLEAAERDLLLDEIVKLRTLVTSLSEAVKPYRDFLERERVRFRGMLRVGRYLAASAASDEERAEATAIREGFDEAYATMEERDRLPRKRTVRVAISALRGGLGAMDRRLGDAMSPAFVESLYPALAHGGDLVADDGDPDDDAAG